MRGLSAAWRDSRMCKVREMTMNYGARYGDLTFFSLAPDSDVVAYWLGDSLTTVLQRCRA